MLTPKEIAYAVTKALDEKKGMDIKLLKIDKVSSLADYFLICTGTCHPDPGTLNLRGEMPVWKSPAEPPAVHRKTPAQHKKLPCEGRFFERGSTLLAAAAPAFKTCNNQ